MDENHDYNQEAIEDAEYDRRKSKLAYHDTSQLLKMIPHWVIEREDHLMEFLLDTIKGRIGFKGLVDLLEPKEANDFNKLLRSVILDNELDK